MAKAREHEEGKGVLLTSNKKANPKSPDLYGEIVFNGQTIPLSGWKRQSAYGELISICVDTYKLQRYQQNATNNSYPRDVTPGVVDSDIPFANPYRGKFIHCI